MSIAKILTATALSLALVGAGLAPCSASAPSTETSAASDMPCCPRPAKKAPAPSPCCGACHLSASVANAWFTVRDSGPTQAAFGPSEVHLLVPQTPATAVEFSPPRDSSPPSELISDRSPPYR
jgi:hypothetical protein